MSDSLYPSGDHAPPYAGPPQPPPRGKATASLTLGICSLVLWFCPAIGLPVCIIGLVLGILARKERQGGMATAGIILSSIGLLLTLANAASGIYLYLTGQHPLSNQFQGF